MLDRQWGAAHHKVIRGSLGTDGNGSNSSSWQQQCKIECSAAGQTRQAGEQPAPELFKACHLAESLTHTSYY